MAVCTVTDEGLKLEILDTRSFHVLSVTAKPIFVIIFAYICKAQVFSQEEPALLLQIDANKKFLSFVA